MNMIKPYTKAMNLVNTSSQQKFELMLTRRTKTYSSSCSVV